MSKQIRTIHCSNCNHELSGAFCANCGQEVKALQRPFTSAVKDAFATVFELDGRIYKTLFYLFFRPAFLSKEYVAGRRVRYVPPFRLFFIISIVFFLMISFATAVSDFGTNFTTSQEDQNFAEDEFEVSPGDEEVADLDAVFIFIDGITLPLISAAGNENFRNALKIQTEENLNAITEDPREFLSSSLEYFTPLMLLLMPLLALLQKILYFRSGHYYVEHFTLILHNQAFIFLVLVITNLLGYIEVLDLSPLNFVTDLAGNVVRIWVVIYLFLSLKYFFGENYFLTTLKFLVASILYGFCFIVGIVVLAILVFFLL